MVLHDCTGIENDKNPATKLNSYDQGFPQTGTPDAGESGTNFPSATALLSDTSDVVYVFEQAATRVCGKQINWRL